MEVTLTTLREIGDELVTTATWPNGRDQVVVALQAHNQEERLSLAVGRPVDADTDIMNPGAINVTMDKAQVVTLRDWLNGNFPALPAGVEMTRGPPRRRPKGTLA